MIKILHLTDHLPEYHEPWGGAEKVAYRHISALIDKEEKWLPFIRAILEQQNSLADEQHEQVDTLEEYRKFSYVCSFKYRYITDE